MDELQGVTPDEVRAFRVDQHLSRSDLAKSLGAGLRTIEDWEGGRRQPPAMLRLAFAALARQISPWKQLPQLGPESDLLAVSANVAALFSQWGDEYAVDLTDQFSDALRQGASAAETFLCAHLMNLMDGYQRVEVVDRWEERRKVDWGTCMAFRPDGFDLRPTVVAEARSKEALKKLVVFVDRHRPGERLPAKVKIEAELIEQGYRVLSFSEVDVLVNGRACAETIDTVIGEMIEEAMFDDGVLDRAWKRPDRRLDDLPND